MDFIDVTFRALTFLVALPACARGAYEIFIGGRSRLREEYKFAHDFLGELNSGKAMHPFVMEKGYHAIAGDASLGSKEVAYLLSLKDSPRALRDFVLGRKYLEHLPHKGDLQVDFKLIYRSKWSRFWRRNMYLSLGIVFWFFSFAPIILSPEIMKYISMNSWLPFAGACMLVFMPNALLALKAWARVFRAEQLVKNQQAHTQRILMDISSSLTSRN